MREVVGLWWHDDHLQVSLANGVSTPIRTKDKQIKLMQSTGLYDKNGVEIFAGDIARINSDSGVVVGVVKKDFYMWYVADFNDKFEGSLYDLDMTGKIDVIGNIYENRELLEG